MLKKLEKHVNDIAKAQGNPVCHPSGDGTFYAWNYMIFRAEHEIPGLEAEPMQDDTYKRLAQLVSPDAGYELFELPTPEELKAGVRNLVGQKRILVAWECDEFAINARWLANAMLALNAKVCYRPVGDYATHRPVLLFEGDDMGASNVEGIMQVARRGEPGFWTAE